MSKTICLWSGGKDAALALYVDHLQRPQEEYILLCTMSTDTDRAMMQGIRRSVISQQAEALQMEVVFVDIPPAQNMEVYENEMTQAIAHLKNQGCHRIIAGDIFLEDLKEYRMQQAQNWQMHIDFPIFGRETKDIIQQMKELDFICPIVALNLNLLDQNLLGQNAIQCTFPQNIDPCGENGEFHTLILQHPMFKKSLNVVAGKPIVKSYVHDKVETSYAFLDYLLNE